MSLTEKEITERLEGLDLPDSIKEAMKSGLEGASLSKEQMDEIVSMVSSDYKHSRVEPCEAVLTVDHQILSLRLAQVAD